MRFYQSDLAKLKDIIKCDSLNAVCFHGTNIEIYRSFVKSISKFKNSVVNRVDLKEESFGKLLSKANNITLDRSHQIIVVTNFNKFHTQIEKWLDTGQILHFIVFVVESTLPKKGFRSFLEKSKDVALVSCYKNTNNHDIKAIENYFARQGKSIDTNGAKMILQSFANNTQLLPMELRKIVTYAIFEDNITQADIKEVIDHDDHSISYDNLIHYFFTQNMQQFLHEEKLLLLDSSNLIMLIRVLMRHSVNLYFYLTHKDVILASKTDIGKNLPFNINFTKLDNFKNHASKIALSDIVKLLNLLYKIEVRLKNRPYGFSLSHDLYLQFWNQ